MRHHVALFLTQIIGVLHFGFGLVAGCYFVWKGFAERPFILNISSLIIAVPLAAVSALAGRIAWVLFEKKAEWLCMVSGFVSYLLGAFALLVMSAGFDWDGLVYLLIGCCVLTAIPCSVGMLRWKRWSYKWTDMSLKIMLIPISGLWIWQFFDKLTDQAAELNWPAYELNWPIDASITAIWPILMLIFLRSRTYSEVFLKKTA